MSRFLASFASVVVGLLAWPAHLLAKAGIRFVHAVPGTGDAQLTVEQEGRTTLVGAAGFGDHTAVKAVRPGPVRWALVSGGTTLATGTGRAASGPMTAVAIPQGERPVVRFFRDATRAPAGKARVRVIHAASELGNPDVRVDGKTAVRGLGFGEATSYFTLVPGRHDLEAVRAGTTDALVARRGARLPGDAVTNAIVIGTSGEPVRIITVSTTVTAEREQGSRAKRSSRSRSERRRAGQEGSYTVRRGDSLWAIARDRLGDGASNAQISREVQRLWNMNHARIGTGDPNLIFPGQQLRMA